jgi:hypothetical protein
MAKPVAASILGMLREGGLARAKSFSLRRCPTAYRSGMVKVPIKAETNLKEKTEIPYSCKARDSR